MERAVHVRARVNPKAEQLKTRTKRFLIDVIAIAKTLPKTPEGDTIRRQLTRAAAGVAGNYHSTCRSRSHDEFVARIGIVLEEADESALWLGVVTDTRMLSSADLATLLDEARQLRAIFSASSRTAQNRSKRRRNQSGNP